MAQSRVVLIRATSRSACWLQTPRHGNAATNETKDTHIALVRQYRVVSRFPIGKKAHIMYAVRSPAPVRAYASPEAPRGSRSRKAYPKMNLLAGSWRKTISMDRSEAGLFCFVPGISHHAPVDSVSDLRTCNTCAFITKYCAVQACIRAHHIVLSKAFDRHGDQTETNCSSW
jgi:hypothetical protein